MQLNSYRIQSTLATKIGFGDPVQRVSATSLYITQATSGASGNNLPIIGIFQGCQFTPSSGIQIPTWAPSWQAPSTNSDAVGYVIDAPGATFLVASFQTSVSTADIGKAINFTTGTPSAVGGQFATATVDQATATSNVTATFMPFKVYGLYEGVGNGSDPTTNFGWCVVTFNNAQWKVLNS